MEDESQVERLLRDIVFLEAVGINPVIVHGGGKAISAKMREAGIAPRFVNGLRVTDEASVKIVEETLDLEINPGIVTTIHKHGGMRRDSLERQSSSRASSRRKSRASGAEADLGFVGEAGGCFHGEGARRGEEGNRAGDFADWRDGGGAGDHINADVAAAALAAGLKAHKLIFVSDVPASCAILRGPTRSSRR